MRAKLSKRICSAILAVAMLLSLAPVTTFAITDEDIPASVELGKGFNLLECKTFESANLKSAILFDSVDTLNPTKVRVSTVESNMTYITSMSSYLDNTHTDISTEVGVTKEGLLAKAEVKAKFGFKGEWESSGTVNTSRLILEILAKAYKYSLNMEMSEPWVKDENDEYVSINPTFAYDLVHMRPEDLFNTYGTHIVTQYDAGGEAYTSYEGTDASNSMKSEFDITTNATVNVSAADIADVNVEVNASGGEKHEDSFANNNKQTSMRVRGGDPFYSTFDKIIAGDADETVNGWLQSMFTMDENTGSTKATMIQTDDLKLMPLWELLEMDYGRDHSVRVAQLRDYFQENANREYLELYEEFIYGIPGDYADNYDVIREAMVTDENLGVVESAPSDRIPIYTEAELNKIGRSADYPLDGKYTLMRDIEMKYDFGGIGYTTDNTIEPFTGDFDGNGHTIYDLNPIARYNGTSEVYMGFILYNRGNLHNIRFEDSNFECRESKKTTTAIKLNVANTAKAYLGLAVGRNVAETNSSNLSNIYIDNATFIITNIPHETYVGLAAGCISDTNFVSDITVVNSYIDVSAALDDGLYHIGAVCGASSSGAGMISHDNVVKCDKDAFVGGCIGSFVSDTNPRVETYSYENEVQSASMSGRQLSGYGDLNAYTFGGSDAYALTSEKLFKYYCDKENIIGGIGGYAEEWKIHSETVAKPWLIVHVPDGVTAYQNSLIRMKNLKVYFAQYGDDTASYEDVTDRVNFVYDFSEIAEDVPVTVVYGKHLVEFTVDVVEPVVTDIAITNKGKTQFRVGEKFDNSLFAGQILYSNNLTDSLSANDEGLTVYIPELEGDNPIDVDEYKFIETSTGTDVVVEYMGCTETYQISVLPEDLEGKLHFSSSNIESAPGGSFDVVIELKNNPGIVALSAYLEYDKDLFEVESITDAKLLNTTNDLLTSDSEEIDKLPTVPLIWIDTGATENNTSSGTLVTVKFKVKQGAFDESVYGMNKIKCVNGKATDKAGNIIDIPDMVVKVKLNKTAIGDVDSNSVIDSWDAVLLMRETFDVPRNIINCLAADINRDGSINQHDSTYLNRYIVGFFGLTGAPGKFDVRVKNKFFDDVILEDLVVNSVLPQPEEKFGYIFGGYYSDADYTNKIEKLPAKSVREIVIYAKYVKFVAQWTADSLAATISAINTLTGVTTRYTFDYTEDFTMPEGSTELILIGNVYYKFDGWYNNAQCEGDPVTVIPANGFDVNNSRYYSKWVETTSSTVIVHNRDTQEVIGEIEVTPGQEYTLPDATEYLKEVLGNEYISNDRFYIKSGTDYTEVTSFNVNFTEKHVYVDVIDVTNMVANIFTVSNYTPLARQLGVKVDGVTHLFDKVSEEKVYTIYTAPDKISTIEVLEQAQNYVNDKADVKYRAEFDGKVVEKERQIRYSNKNAGYDRVIYSPIIKDEYTLDLYVPQYKTSKLLTSTTVYNFAIHQRVAGLNLLEGYPQQIARGETITLPVLDDLSITEFGDSTWVDYMNKCGLSEEQKATLKMKFVGWFERPYYTGKNEQPITEIDTTMIGQDIQLYAIYEPEAVLFTYDNGKSYDILSGDNLTMIKMVYALTKNPKEQLYDTSEIENGRLVKAMPSEYSAYSYLVKGITETVSVDHPYATNSAYTCLYNGTVVNQTYSEYNSSANTTGYEIFYVKDAYSPQNYGPDLSLEE